LVWASLGCCAFAIVVLAVGLAFVGLKRRHDRGQMACGVCAEPGRPRSSASGRYLLAVDVAGGAFDRYALISVVDTTASYATPEQARMRLPGRYTTRHRTHVMWDREERVWVYSGDVGTYVYTGAGGSWERRAAVDTDLCPPEEMARLASGSIAGGLARCADAPARP
jgi:hypothetical protein